MAHKKSMDGSPAEDEPGNGEERKGAVGSLCWGGEWRGPCRAGAAEAGAACRPAASSAFVSVSWWEPLRVAVGRLELAAGTGILKNTQRGTRGKICPVVSGRWGDRHRSRSSPPPLARLPTFMSPYAILRIPLHFHCSTTTSIFETTPSGSVFRAPPRPSIVQRRRDPLRHTRNIWDIIQYHALYPLLQLISRSSLHLISRPSLHALSRPSSHQSSEP